MAVLGKLLAQEVQTINSLPNLKIFFPHRNIWKERENSQIKISFQSYAIFNTSVGNCPVQHYVNLQSICQFCHVWAKTFAGQKIE